VVVVVPEPVLPLEELPEPLLPELPLELLPELLLPVLALVPPPPPHADSTIDANTQTTTAFVITTLANRFQASLEAGIDA